LSRRLASALLAAFLSLSPAAPAFGQGLSVPPHPAGAGDQRPGGVDAEGNRIPVSARFEDGLMNMGQARTNDQTRGEIFHS
jgi:hypothetical protein